MLPTRQGDISVPRLWLRIEGSRKMVRRKQRGKTALRKTMGTTVALRTEKESRAKRRMTAQQTNYGKMTTTVHSLECRVWETLACDCDAPSTTTRGSGVARRSKAGQKRYDQLRRAVIARDGGKCRYCGDKAKVIEVDHVLPWSKGGRDSMENLVTACKPCNQEKFDATHWEPIPLEEL